MSLQHLACMQHDGVLMPLGLGQTSEVAEVGCSFPGPGWGHPKDTAVLDLFPFVIHLVQEDFLNPQVMQRCLPVTARAAPPLPPRHPELPLHTALALWLPKDTQSWLSQPPKEANPRPLLDKAWP